MVYYNDNDPFCVEWIKELVKAGMIAPGDVDNRSIRDVKGSDLTGYTQCHFFAGIGGWSYALRLAGVPDDYPVWTGSCPCQPFSVAGKRKGTKDERHLWPELRRLISECNSPTVFGEQVASKAGRLWLSGVFADLEALGYSRAGADLCAAGIGAPHIRQRLYWVADRISKGSQGRAVLPECPDQWAAWESGVVDGMGIPYGTGSLQRSETAGGNDSFRLPDSEHGRLPGEHRGGAGSFPAEHDSGHDPREPFWADSIIIPCADGKARRIKPGLMPLAHGVSNRVGLIRGYGNAIVPQLAAEFIRAFFEANR